jgi:nucleoid-associated protein YgaU
MKDIIKRSLIMAILSHSHLTPWLREFKSPSHKLVKSTYIVQPGDSLWSLASEKRLFSIDKIGTIAVNNNLKNPNIIRPGQTLELDF